MPPRDLGGRSASTLTRRWRCAARPAHSSGALHGAVRARRRPRMGIIGYHLAGAGIQPVAVWRTSGKDPGSTVSRCWAPSDRGRRPKRSWSSTAIGHVIILYGDEEDCRAVVPTRPHDRCRGLPRNLSSSPARVGTRRRREPRRSEPTGMLRLRHGMPLAMVVAPWDTTRLLTVGGRTSCGRRRQRTGKLAVTRLDGSPHVAPVWVAVDGDGDARPARVHDLGRHHQGQVDPARRPRRGLLRRRNPAVRVRHDQRHHDDVDRSTRAAPLGHPHRRAVHG